MIVYSDPNILCAANILKCYGFKNFALEMKIGNEFNLFISTIF